MTAEQKRMTELINSTIDLWVKLENRREGFTQAFYTPEIKKLEKELNSLYKDNKLDKFIPIIGSMRDKMMSCFSKLNQLEMKL